MKTQLVTGDPGGGKTSRLHELALKWAAQGLAFRAVLQPAVGPRTPGLGAQSYDLLLLEFSPGGPLASRRLAGLATRRPVGGYDFLPGAFEEARAFLTRPPLPPYIILDEVGDLEVAVGGHTGGHGGALAELLALNVPELTLVLGVKASALEAVRIRLLR